MAKAGRAIVDELEGHIEQLISKYETLVSENFLLKEETKRLRIEVDNNNNKLKELEKKIEQLQLAKAFSASSTDVKEAKHKIMKIVKEIDKCISLLND